MPAPTISPRNYPQQTWPCSNSAMHIIKRFKICSKVNNRDTRTSSYFTFFTFS